MLSQLYIKNIAVISEAAIDFTGGLNVFTGETGAGKTILISAINAVLGERTSKEIIRTGEEKAVISALFTGLSPAAAAALGEAGYPPEEDGVLISREITADGKSACRIDGRPATAAILKTVAAHLINVHGQHDNQQLLSPAKHLGFIDGYGELEPMLEEYRNAYRAYSAARRELEQIDTDEAEKARRIDLLGYQIGEIDAAGLTAGEEDELRAQRKLLKNALAVTEAARGASRCSTGTTRRRGLSSQLGALGRADGAGRPLYGRGPAGQASG